MYVEKIYKENLQNQDPMAVVHHKLAASDRKVTSVTLHLVRDRRRGDDPVVESSSRPKLSQLTAPQLYDQLCWTVNVTGGSTAILIAFCPSG